METNLRTLGAKETKVVLTFREQAREVVHATDIINLLGSEQTARKVIRNLIRKGWLTRLVGGRYMLLPPEHGPENLGENNPIALAAAVTEPSYIGWWSAAAFHGFTTQKPMTVTVATQRQIPTRTIEGTEVRFIKIAARKFFGFQKYTIYDRSAAITEPEKTVVDCIDRPDLAGGPAELTRIVYSAMGETDHAKLITAALAMKSTALLQRLGFLTDLTGRKLPEELRSQVRSAIPNSRRSIFGRRERKDGDIGYVAEWGLFVYARRDDLLAEVPRIKGASGEPPC
jgi:predicted transcriptional regulator of viral defense system